MISSALSRIACSLLVLTGVAQVDDPGDAGTLLRRAKGVAAENAARLPRITCDMTISRYMYLPSGGLRQRDESIAGHDDLLASHSRRRLDWTDRSRLELALFGGKEFFCWRGEREFRTEALENMLMGGVANSGEFGPFLISILLSDSDPASFRYLGRSMISGRTAVEYGYLVSRENSHYSIRTDLGHAATAYQGFIWIDSETSELIRLSVSVNKAPEGSHVVAAFIVTEYEPIQGSKASGLVPSQSTLRLLLDSGGLAVNKTSYSGCREYTSESRVLIENKITDVIPQAPDAIKKTALSSILPGIVIETFLKTPIDSKTTWTGDPIEMQVVSDATEHGAVMVPKGATLSGHVIGLQQHYFPQPYFLLRLRISALKSGSAWMPIRLKPVLKTEPGQAKRQDEIQDNTITRAYYKSGRFRLGKETLFRWITE